MYSFRVTVTADGQPPVVEELNGDIPPGVYQVSGDDPAPPVTPAHTVTIVRHGQDGVAVIGASGYGG